MSILVKCEIIFRSLHCHNLGNERTINLTFFDEENECLCILIHATNFIFISEVAPNVCKWVQVMVLEGRNALELMLWVLSPVNLFDVCFSLHRFSSSELGHSV